MHRNNFKFVTKISSLLLLWHIIAKLKSEIGLVLNILYVKTYAEVYQPQHAVSMHAGYLPLLTCLGVADYVYHHYNQWNSSFNLQPRRRTHSEYLLMILWLSSSWQNELTTVICLVAGLIRLRSSPPPRLQGVQYVLNITATDDNASGGPQALSSTAQVIVGVDDVNNNKPVFEEVRRAILHSYTSCSLRLYGHRLHKQMLSRFLSSSERWEGDFCKVKNMFFCIKIKYEISCFF